MSENSSDSDSTERQPMENNYRHHYKVTKTNAKRLLPSSPLDCEAVIEESEGTTTLEQQQQQQEVTKSVQKNHDSKNGKIVKKASPPSTASNGNTVAVGIRTSTKQSMDYVTINGIAQRINYTVDKFPEWIQNELMINAIDFLNNNYYSKPNARMIVWVNLKQDHELLRIKVRNSNDLNINPFPSGLPAIFDLSRFDSTKRHQRGISGGALGDALKEILAIPYALISSTDDGSSFTRKQWEEPLVIRFCGQEYRVYLHVNKTDDNNPISTWIDGPFPIPIAGEGNSDDGGGRGDSVSCIEVQVTIPVIPDILRNRRIGLSSPSSSLVGDLERQYKKYFLARSRRMEFHFYAGGGK